MNPPLRIMLWHWGRRGAGPRYTLELARAMKDRDDVELHLSVSRQCECIDEFRSLGVPIFEVDTYTDIVSCITSSAGLPFLYRRFRRYLESHRIEIIDSTMPHLWTRPLVPFLRKAGLKVILTVHDAIRHAGEKNALNDFLFHPVPPADAYITLTNFVAASLKSDFKIPEENLCVIPLGTLSYEGAGSSEEEASVEKNQGPPQILFFGRILPYKGVELLLEAYEKLREANVACSLRIAGSGDFEPYRDMASKLPDVDLDIRWIEDSETPSILQQSSIVVLPYREGTQSGVTAAAFAVGRPVLVTPVGGLTEQVRHGYNGFIAAAPTSDALYDSLREVLGDEALLQRLSDGALATARQEMSWSGIAGRVTDLAQSLVERKGAA